MDNRLAWSLVVSYIEEYTDVFVCRVLSSMHRLACTNAYVKVSNKHSFKKWMHLFPLARECHALSASDLEYLSTGFFPSLHHLSSYYANSQDLLLVGQFPNLKSLFISRCDIDTVLLISGLKNMPSLEALTLDEVKMSLPNLDLKEIISLRHLRLDMCGYPCLLDSTKLLIEISSTCSEVELVSPGWSHTYITLKFDDLTRLVVNDVSLLHLIGKTIDSLSVNNLQRYRSEFDFSKVDSVNRLSLVGDIPTCLMPSHVGILLPPRQRISGIANQNTHISEFRISDDIITDVHTDTLAVNIWGQKLTLKNCLIAKAIKLRLMNGFKQFITIEDNSGLDHAEVDLYICAPNQERRSISLKIPRYIKRVYFSCYVSEKMMKSLSKRYPQLTFSMYHDMNTFLIHTWSSTLFCQQLL